MNDASVFPELVVSRRGGLTLGPWHVERGSTQRGSASCDLHRRILQVPLGRDQNSRVVRAHELMHARTSPLLHSWPAPLLGIHERALECVEEFRVNTLLSRLSFDTSQLCDGSEKRGGQRLAALDEWDEVVCFLMAVLGTGAEKDYLSGIRKERPEWMAGLRALKQHAEAHAEAMATSAIASTVLRDDTLPEGYYDFTVTLARIVSASMSVAPPTTPEHVRRFRRSLEPGGRRAPTGKFAPLQLATDMQYQSRSARGSRRRHRSSVTGASLRYPSRWITDTHRRMFAASQRQSGAVIVVDQSGSMDIDPVELATVLQNVPDALILGYSHAPGDATGRVNAWVIARRGEVAEELPIGNIGNGVDGPALSYALEQRRPGEPIIWVTDGQVTDSNDHPNDQLTTDCAELVRRHRIRLVRNIGEVASILRGAKSAESPASFGRLGRVLASLDS